MPERKGPRLVVASESDAGATATEDHPVSPDPPAPDEPVVLRRAAAPGGGEYQARPEGLFFVRDDVEMCIANFDAELLRRGRRRNQTDLALRITIGGLQRQLSMSGSRFESLRWIVDSVPGGVLAPLPAARARFLAAVTLLSSPEEVSVVEHLGWIRGEQGQWLFAHAGGAIGAEGEVSLDVEVDDPLDRAVLPAPDEVDARLPIDLLDLVPDRIGVCLLSAMARAVFGEVRFAVWAWGTTGTRKSSVAQVVQGYWGAAFAREGGLPCSWKDTANASELVAHAAKDTLVVVDDWLPSDTPVEQVDRLLRSLANSSGRRRMGSSARPPRAAILSTAEGVPTNPASLVARMVAIRFREGDVDLDQLTIEQQRGATGEHARWLAAFLRWCAPQLDELRRRLELFVAEGRRRWSSYVVHPRTVDALANLEAGWRTLIAYIWARDGLTLEDAQALVRRGQVALAEVAGEQERLQLGGDPVKLFLTTLRELVATGIVRVAASTRERADKLRTPTVAWRRDREVLVDPGVALQVVQDRLALHGDSLDVSEQQLGKLLRESRILVRVDGRGFKIRYAIRVTAGGQRRRVWVLRVEAVGLLGEG